MTRSAAGGLLRALAAWAAVAGLAAAQEGDDVLGALGVKTAPPAGTPRMVVWQQYPRYFTASIEFHDPEDAMWPAYFLARPATTNGWFEFGEKQHKGQFAVKSHMMAQVDGSQDKRLGGERVRLKEVEGRDGAKEQRPFGPDLLFTLGTMDPIAVDERTVMRRTDKGLEPQIVKTDYTPVTGVLAMDQRELPVKGKLYANLRPELNRVLQKMEFVAVPMRLVFEVKGRDLGLNEHADKTVLVNVYAEAFLPPRSLADLQTEIGVPKAQDAQVEETIEEFKLDP